MTCSLDCIPCSNHPLVNLPILASYTLKMGDALTNDFSESPSFNSNNHFEITVEKTYSLDFLPKILCFLWLCSKHYHCSPHEWWKFLSLVIACTAAVSALPRDSQQVGSFKSWRDTRTYFLFGKADSCQHPVVRIFDHRLQLRQPHLKKVFLKIPSYIYIF